MKKLLAIICFIIIIFGITSCANYEDIKPNESDFSEWDGNFIYKGNYKSRTNGENEKILIEYVEYEGHKYYVDLNNYTYLNYNNEIYFSFFTSSKIDKDVDSSFIVKYSPKDKNYQVLFASADELLYLYIEKVYNDYVFVRYDVTGQMISDILYINVKTLEYNLIENVKSSSYFNNGILFVQDGYLKAINPKTLEINSIIKYEKDYTYQCYSKDDNMVSVVINNSEFFSDLIIYNFNTSEIKTLLIMDDGFKIQFINNEYFIVWSYNTYEMVSGISKESTIDYKVNNKIYKVDYDNLTFKLVYEFENKDASYLGGYVKDNFYYMKQGVIKRGWFIFKGKEKLTSYKLDLSSFELSVDKANTIDNKEIVKETVSFNGDNYYMELVGFGIAISKPYGVYIYKTNNDNSKKELMQFFVYQNDSVSEEYEGTKSAVLMWNDYLIFDSNFVMILDY